MNKVLIFALCVRSPVIFLVRLLHVALDFATLCVWDKALASPGKVDLGLLPDRTRKSENGLVDVSICILDLFLVGDAVVGLGGVEIELPRIAANKVCDFVN